MEDERDAFYAKLRLRLPADFASAAEVFGNNPHAERCIEAAASFAKEAPPELGMFDEIAALHLFGATWGDDFDTKHIVNQALREQREDAYIPFIRLVVEGLRKQASTPVTWFVRPGPARIVTGDRILCREFTACAPALSRVGPGEVLCSLSAEAYHNPLEPDYSERVVPPYALLRVRGVRREIDFCLIDFESV